MKSLAEQYSFSLDEPLKSDDDVKKVIMYGAGGERIRVRYRNHKGEVRFITLNLKGLQTISAGDIWKLNLRSRGKNREDGS